MIALEDVATEDPEARRKAVLCWWQGVGVYAKLCEVGEIENRLAALEQRLVEGTPHAKP
jgi:hypothetical protein